MNLRHIRYFVAVAEELHFSRAAQKLHISQPPLSMSIQQLENDLGFQLFIRTNKSVSLTDAGRLFYQEALQLLRHADEMQRVGERAAKGTIGHLRLGFASSMLFRGLHDKVHAYRARYPDVEVSLHELNSSEQLKALQREQIDIGFVHNHQNEAGISTHLFVAEHFVCCLTTEHALAQAAVVPVGALRNEIFLLFPRTLSPHYYDRIMAICVNAGFSPYIIHEVRNWLTIVEMVSQSLGVALVPRSMSRLWKSNVVYRPIDNGAILSETHCVWRSNSRSILVRNFLEENIQAGLCWEG
uniref:LysR family transcriptional regulator n=1 Tax=Castellaniella defragrans TaxID=75697 RepID=UPI0033404F43